MELAREFFASCGLQSAGDCGNADGTDEVLGRKSQADSCRAGRNNTVEEGVALPSAARHRLA